MYSAAWKGGVVFKDGFQVYKSGKVPKNGDIVITTLDMNAGKVSWKVQGGQDLGEITDERAKSGLWYFAVCLGNGGVKIEILNN